MYFRVPGRYSKFEELQQYIRGVEEYLCIFVSRDYSGHGMVPGLPPRPRSNFSDLSVFPQPVIRVITIYFL